MDYKELIENLNQYSAEHQNHGGISARAADAITDLLARAEAAEARAEKAEREKGAAIHDVFEAASAKCFWCKHQDHKWLSDGKMDDLCYTCLKNNKCNWEWRGQKEE